jgi:hypothetical protein
MTTAAQQKFLDRESPVTAILGPFAAGDVEWDPTRDALYDVEWADVPRGTADQLMGRDGGEYVAGLEAGGDPEPGSWDELLAAQDLGLLSSEQVGEVLAELVGRSDAKA